MKIAAVIFVVLGVVAFVIYSIVKNQKQQIVEDVKKQPKGTEKGKTLLIKPINKTATRAPSMVNIQVSS